MNRTVTAVLVVAMVVFAGCSASIPGSTDGDTDGETGTVGLYVSDERNAIDQFAHLNVTVDEVSFRTGTNASAETNGSTGVNDSNASAEGAWQTHAVGSTTVDLTKLQGENATHLGNLTVTSGDYSAVRLSVTDVEATLTNGERVDVKLPSDRLRLNDEFAVGQGERVSFVFDITVFEAGNSGQFVLKPVASESGTDQSVRLVDGRTGAVVRLGGGVDGTAGTEVDVGANATIEAGGSGAGASVDGESSADVDANDGLELHVAGMPAPGETVTVEVTDEGRAVTGARVVVDGETVGRTDADGTLDVTLPSAGTTTLRVEHGSSSVDAEFVFG